MKKQQNTDQDIETIIREQSAKLVKAQFATLSQVREVLGLSGHQVASAVRTGKLKAKRVEFVVLPEDVAHFQESYVEVTADGVIRVRQHPKQDGQK